VLTVRAIVTIVAAGLLGLPRERSWGRHLLAGLAIAIGYYGATTIAYGIAPASVASLGLASEPLLLVVLRRRELRRARGGAVAGLSLAAIGLAGAQSASLSTRALVGLVLVAFAGASFVVGARILPPTFSPIAALRSTALAQALGSVVLLGAVAAAHRLDVPKGLAAWALVSGLVAGSSLLGIAIFVRVATAAPLIAAGSVGLVPPLGSALAAALLHDPFGWHVVAASVAAALAIVLGALEPPPRTTPRSLG
jgi:drug/metabolite transporter (DMT)-like permease